MKVIFCDVDGVLNDTTKTYEVDDKRVRRLSKLVRKTNAKVVLSSNWRLVYTLYKQHQPLHPSQKMAIKKLLFLFKLHHIEIYDITPTIGYGPESRPLEIKRWITMNHPDSYVIFDDEIFWKWDTLKDHVITTSQTFNNEWHAGLNDEHIEKALYILEGIE